MDWHQLSGLAILGLLAFRILWGLFGSSTARFGQFVRGPRATWSYLRGRGAKAIGHNPLGALSVLAMLAVLALQAGTGLFSNDDILLEGPYASLVGKETSDWLSGVHKINSNVILVLIALHLVAIAYYFFRRRNNLIAPMVTGKKLTAVEVPQASRPAWLAVTIMLVVAGGLYWLLGR